MCACVGLLFCYSSEYVLGMENIKNKILKLCSALISRPFSYICNKSIMEGVSPDHLKYAIIRQLYKKGGKSRISNFRPISLLTVFSKVLHKTMYHRLNQHLQINSILVPEEFGFRQDLSTEHAACSLIDRILQAWSNKLHVTEIFCDLVKAFDFVDLEILI
jgi:hypothetical protein